MNSQQIDIAKSEMIENMQKQGRSHKYIYESVFDFDMIHCPELQPNKHISYNKARAIYVHKGQMIRDMVNAGRNGEYSQQKLTEYQELILINTNFYLL